jgi:glycosyltransferase involved in cell wall biosynthesis
MAPRVTTVIPCFNGAQYIRRAVESALDQQRVENDVVVVDDGSTDGFAAVIEPYRHRVLVHHQSNQGLAASRNLGVRLCESEFVAFLDADDWWAPSKLASQLVLLSRCADTVLVHTKAALVGADDEPIDGCVRRHVPAAGSCLPSLLVGNSIIVSSVVVRRACLGSDPFEQGLTGVEDWDLWLRLAAVGEFGYIDEPLTYYRVHDSNMSRNLELMTSGAVRVLDRAIGRLGDRPLLEIARRHRARMMLTLGHLAYERGELSEARAALIQGMREWGWADGLRFLAVQCPPGFVAWCRRILRG